MSIFDKLFGSTHDHPTLNNMAEKLGIDADVAEKAICALANAHQEDGDTVAVAASTCGLDESTLRSVLDQIGGEGSLTQFKQILDADHAGKPLGVD